jgi:NAD(P)-dependent dehydrogenase (short-subunit alcohol dehydrogenase family)
MTARVENETFRSNTPAGSEAEARLLSMIPLRRLGRPEEIAAAIALPLSDEAGFIHRANGVRRRPGSIGRTAL